MNLFENLPTDFTREVFENLSPGHNVRIERIVSFGHASPDGYWYDQVENEWVILLQGQARLRIDGQADAMELGVGDYVNIPAHQRHRVEWTTPGQPTIWLAVFYS